MTASHEEPLLVPCARSTQGYLSTRNDIAHGIKLPSLRRQAFRLELGIAGTAKLIPGSGSDFISQAIKQLTGSRSIRSILNNAEVGDGRLVIRIGLISTQFRNDDKC